MIRLIVGLGKHLAEFDYPCTAIKQVVPAAEDIRRVDLACSVASGEVSVDKINVMDEEEVKHVLDVSKFYDGKREGGFHRQ